MQQNRLANGREDEKNKQWPEEITAERERVEEISTNVTGQRTPNGLRD